MEGRGGEERGGEGRGGEGRGGEGRGREERRGVGWGWEGRGGRCKHTMYIDIGSQNKRAIIVRISINNITGNNLRTMHSRQLNTTVSGDLRPEGQKPIDSDPAFVVGLHGEGNELVVPREIGTHAEHVLMMKPKQALCTCIHTNMAGVWRVMPAW